MTEMTDKEQIEMLKKWWHDYGKAITLAVVVGLAVGFGWRYWRQYKLEQAQSASGIYQRLLTAGAVQNDKEISALSTVLMNKYKSSPYASLASLLLANGAIVKKDLPQAQAHLAWVVKNGKLPSLQQVARLREARVLLAQKKPAKALQVLAVVNDQVYAPLISKVKGDIYTAQGNHKAAQAAYQKAKNGMSNVGITDPFLSLKMAGA